MKKYLLLSAMLIIAGCSSVVPLSHSPSDLVLVTVKPENSLSVQSTVNSDLPEPFTYKNSNGYQFVFHFNSAFEDAFQSYFMSKFASDASAVASAHVDVRASDLVIDYGFEQSTLEGLDTALNGNVRGNATVNVTLSFVVQVSGDSIRTTKKSFRVSSSVEQHISGGGVEAVYGKAVNDCIDKSIIYTEKYLQGLLK